MYKFYTNILGMRNWHIPRLFLIMRLTTIILLTTMVHASALTTAQTVTISKTNASLVEVFSDITKQTDYDFFYSSKQLAEAKMVTINIKNGTIDQVLEQCFREQPFSYSIKNKIITIKTKQPASVEKKTNRFGAITITGSVTDTLGKALVGASVNVLGESSNTRTNKQGDFTIRPDQNSGVLAISYVGYKTEQVDFSEGNLGPFKVTLKEVESGLKEVEVVSTGYQSIPKERATGSFVQIDNKLLNRKVGMNILDRLDGVTSGLIFNKSNPTSYNNSAITIRGRSTIFANANPLIVLDNFPYDGDLNNINPNDIDKITVLKDAAAASIWGAFSGNGVIVITTKKGKQGSTINISGNTNNTIANKPDLHYQPQMSSSDFIDLEQYLFNRGFYNNIISNGYQAISPAVAIMLQRKNGEINASDSALRINQLKQFDVRDQMEKYLYRKSLQQQYSFSLDGGSNDNQYYVSAGYDNQLKSTRVDSYNRFTFNANNTYFLLQKTLKLTSGILLTSSTDLSGTVYSNPFVPYEQFADGHGNKLPVLRSLRSQYIDTAGKGKLLDWNYRPLDELSPNSKGKLTDYKLNAGINYTVLNGLEMSLTYQFQRGINNKNTVYAEDSFYTRNLINSFTQLNQATLVATRPIPVGAINEIRNNDYSAHYGRLQTNYIKKFGEAHDVNILAGLEVKDFKNISVSNTLFGYNPSDASSKPVDFITNFPQYYGFNTSRIGYSNGESYNIDRFRSAFFNASYVYLGKYILSASARRDESNLFGVKANQKGVPLWSAGLLWNLSREKFYENKTIPDLKLRATYGYNGSVDRTTSAYLTAAIFGATNPWNSIYGTIINPPNPSLRWEKVQNINIGTDFTFKNNLISGSFDYFIKKGLDLIANSPISPQTGVDQFKGNSANTKTIGFDLILNKNFVETTGLGWESNLLFSYNKETITSYKVKQGTNGEIVNSNYTNPLVGYPYYAVFSFPFKGLDDNGKPQGEIDGKVSQDYTGIISSTDISNLTYNGSAIPTIYGSLRNTFRYQNFSLSLNIIYKFNYWFRRSLVFSGSDYAYNFADFEKRWQSKGDESTTNIPALYYPAVSAQSGFYRGSSALIEKGDHIRLQDLRVAYDYPATKQIHFFKKIQVYCYLNNLGVIWKATSQNIDPDFLNGSYINPRTFSIGLNANF